MLEGLKEFLLGELQIPDASPAALAILRTRATNVRGVSGNHRIESFVMRLEGFRGTRADLESLASMATDRLPGNWNDSDIERARLHLAELARNFLHLEGLAHVAGRADNRRAMAVAVGLNGDAAPVYEEFSVSEMDRSHIDELRHQLETVLAGQHEQRRLIILAALAELSSMYMARVETNEQRRRD